MLNLIIFGGRQKARGCAPPFLPGDDAIKRTWRTLFASPSYILYRNCLGGMYVTKVGIIPRLLAINLRFV